MLPCLLCCPLWMFRPTSVISLSHASFHRRFGRPLLFPGISTSTILLTMCPSFILITWLFHFSHFSVIFLDAFTTLIGPLMCSFRFLSLLVTSHIHLNILISITSSNSSSNQNNTKLNLLSAVSLPSQNPSHKKKNEMADKKL